LVSGYWGFAATPTGDIGEIERLARAAVAQARVNARGTPRAVELGAVSRAVGDWRTPIEIDPFDVPIEEKLAAMQGWSDYAQGFGVRIDPMASNLDFFRQEHVVSTSDGASFRQTLYESGGKINVKSQTSKLQVPIQGLTPSSKGWEFLLDADIPGQLRTVPAQFRVLAAQPHAKPAQVGRYTLVCDGATMAALLDRTIGIATQLDRALGYEANASGTSFLNDPLEMLGSFKIGSPLVTVTANRSTLGQLATVKWDAEGVEPQPFTLVKDGILVDMQTTREQAAWLAPYYNRVGRPLQSHGCSRVEDALTEPMQHMPNLALAPSRDNVDLDTLVASVKDGILIRNGMTSTDFQARTGELRGEMYEIRNGKLGPQLIGGAVLYDTLDLWRHVVAIGGVESQTTLGISKGPIPTDFWKMIGRYPVKGEPPQFTSYSVQAPKYR
jgi:TldD protein